MALLPEKEETGDREADGKDHEVDQRVQDDPGGEEGGKVDEKSMRDDCRALRDHVTYHSYSFPSASIDMSWEGGGDIRRGGLVGCQ